MYNVGPACRPSIREINAARDRATSAREARVGEFNSTRVDRGRVDGLNYGAACIPSDTAPSSWLETKALQVGTGRTCARHVIHDTFIPRLLSFMAFSRSPRHPPHVSPSFTTSNVILVIATSPITL